MYVGRMLAVGKNNESRNSIMYRVSSRSFPNRQAIENKGHIAIIPRPGAESDLKMSPYIAYNALTVLSNWAIASNGSHTDPIVEKIASGMAIRDAITITLLALDYEKDDFNTPRIAGVIPLEGNIGWLGIVRKDAIVIQEVPLLDGIATYIATYELDSIQETQRSDFDADSASDAAAFIIKGGAFQSLEKPVTSAAALATQAGFEIGTFIVE